MDEWVDECIGRQTYELLNEFIDKWKNWLMCERNYSWRNEMINEWTNLFMKELQSVDESNE